METSGPREGVTQEPFQQNPLNLGLGNGTGGLRERERKFPHLSSSSTERVGFRKEGKNNILGIPAHVFSGPVGKVNH